MTDKEKVIQLLLDNGFERRNDRWSMFKNNEYRVFVGVMEDVINISPIDESDPTNVFSFLELVGFLYLKYGKVYISEI